MLVARYFDSVRKVLEKIEKTQQHAIDSSAECIVNSVLNGGTWNVYDTGHMLMHEAVGRAGGLMMVTPIFAEAKVNHPARPRSLPPNPDRLFLDQIRDMPRFILSQAKLVAGDILMIGSVSGVNVLPVELAMEARKMNLTVIAMTSVSYSKQLEPQHESGQRLFEAADIVLDNCVPYGDALLEVDGLDEKICAISGIAASSLIWSVQAAVVEKLLQRGEQPSIYISNHLPGAGKYNARAKKRYFEQGI